MRVVVTGSGGRVGRAIFARLSHHHEVIGIDRFPASSAVRHVGDVADGLLLDRAFEGAQAVVHVAALHAPHVGILSDAEFERVNVIGTAEVIAAARRAGIRRIVFTSTTALYGQASRGTSRASWVDEDVEPRPITIYHRTKLAAEGLLREAVAEGGLEVRVLRMSRCFPEPADLMAVYRLCRGIDPRDVAAAHEAALVHDGGPLHTWIISGATPFRRSDAEALATDAPAVLRARAPALVLEFERRKWSLPKGLDRVYDAGRANSDLRWQPRHGFAEVLSLLDQGHAEVLPVLPPG